jgi:putative oxidoreductase
MNRSASNVIVVGRILVAIVFILNATGIVDQTEAARELAARGAPSDLVPFLMLAARSVEFIGGVALAFGILPRLGAVALLVFLIAATYVGHAFWLATSTPVFMGQLINFGKNLAMMGGLLFIASVENQPALRWGVARRISHHAVFSGTQKDHS